MKGAIFDYRLGYVRESSELAGFDVLGEDGAPDGRIVTLGGYTTPEMAKSKTSWANYLYERFQSSGKNIQLLNGDTDGYSSAQELTMFVRDVILFRPKLVICFSGFYNFAYKLGLVKNPENAKILKTHHFTNSSQIDYFKEITSHFGLGNDKMYYGEENNVPTHEYWLGHVEIMHCLCEEFGMGFMEFLQPSVFSGGYITRERAFLLEREFDITSAQLAEISEGFVKLYAETSDCVKNKGYITDLTGLFANEPKDVYVDACHVYDNKIISEAIYSAVKPIIGVEDR